MTTYKKMQKQDGELEAVEVSTVKQENLTKDCWLVQFRGLKACANCDLYLQDNCRGGETLTRILLDKINISPYELNLIGKFWNNNPDGTFKDLLDYLDNQDFGVFRLKKEYKEFVEQELARQVENRNSNNTLTLETEFAFDDIIEQGEIVEKHGYHQVDNQGFGKSCDCRALTEAGGAYRDLVVDLNENIRVYYLHQNPIVVRTPDHYLISDCGWRTKLTKDRINRILGYNQGRIFSEGKYWYLRLPKPKRANSGAIDYRRFYSGMKIKRYKKYDKDKIFS